MRNKESLSSLDAAAGGLQAVGWMTLAVHLWLAGEDTQSPVHIPLLPCHLGTKGFILPMQEQRPREKGPA